MSTKIVKRSVLLAKLSMLIDVTVSLMVLFAIIGCDSQKGELPTPTFVVDSIGETELPSITDESGTIDQTIEPTLTIIVDSIVETELPSITNESRATNLTVEPTQDWRINKGFKMLLRSINRSSVVIYEPYNDHSYQKESIYGMPISFLDIDPNNCNTVFMLDNFNLIEWDQNHNSDKLIFNSAAFMNGLDPGEHIWQMYISPDHSWLGIVTGKGNLGFDEYEIQNLYMVSLRENIIVKLTNYGGAILPSVQPTFNLLAYTDNDSKGYHTLLVSETDGKNPKPIFSVPEQSDKIRKILWSPYGKKLAILMENVSRGVTRVATIDLDGSNTVEFIPEIFGITNFWWSHESEIMIDATRIMENNSILDIRRIYKFDIDSGESELLITDDDTPEGFYELAGPLNLLNSDLGFSSIKSFFAFDEIANKYMKVFDKFSDFSEWTSCFGN